MAAFTPPAGFRFAGHACGIKGDPSKTDLALFVSETPCAAAGVFTQNRVVGAPVKVSRERVPSDSVRGVIINSGNANACTGQRGLEDARWMTAQVAGELGCAESDILVCSTGVIGRFLPREKLAPGIPAAAAKLSGTADALQQAARAIMTTDTVPKLAARTVQTAEGTVTVCGVAKGAAMIAPHMATMLAVVMTDAALSPSAAHAVLKRAVESSFNCISVDEHTSTSDTVLLLANGASGRSGTAGGNAGETADQTAPGSARETLQGAVTDVCTDLAQQIIRDAEGAGHFVTIDVRGTRDREDAWCIAKVVAESPLVKTAVTGNDPNWGRIVSAAGYAGVPFEESHCSLSINGIAVYRQGTPTDYDAAAVSRAMASGEVHIELTFTLGEGAARFWTSDLTQEYVRLNSEYTT